jgi:hypothetical protein
MLTLCHLLDVSLPPPSHIILASNSGPPRLSNVCPIGRTRREHYRLSLTRPSWTSRTDLSSETGITQCILGFSIWLYRKTDNLRNLASSTQIEPFKMTSSPSGIQILLQVYYIVFLLFDLYSYKTDVITGTPLYTSNKLLYYQSLRWYTLL